MHYQNTIVYYVTYLIVLLATILIEKWRISYKKGKVVNIDKTLTKVIAIGTYVLLVVLFAMPTRFNLLATGMYGIYCAGLRGFLWDPVLNVLRGLYIDYESPTTNSRGDRLERDLGLNFWAQRGLYAAVAVIGVILFEWSKKF